MPSRLNRGVDFIWAPDAPIESDIYIYARGRVNSLGSILGFRGKLRNSGFFSAGNLYSNGKD